MKNSFYTKSSSIFHLGLIIYFYSLVCVKGDGFLLCIPLSSTYNDSRDYVLDSLLPFGY